VMKLFAHSESPPCAATPPPPGKARNKALKKQFESSKACRRPWLCCRRNRSGAWGLGCAPCSALEVAVAAKKIKSPRCRRNPAHCVYSNFEVATLPKEARLLKHERSVHHRLAVKYTSKGTVQLDPACIAKAAPAKETFQKLLRHFRRRGKSSEVDGIGKHCKIRRMLWCLAEAKRVRARRVLAKSRTIAIHQDKGQGHLHTRFTACNDKLQRVSGIVGLTCSLGGHREIIASTKEVLQTFCTLGCFRPGSEFERRREEDTRRREEDTRSHGDHFNEVLHDAIRKKVHLYNADGASDCQLAGQVMHKAAETRTVMCQGSDVFENLKVVNWDAAHASRRLTSRPWATDDYLKVDRLRLVALEEGSGEVLEEAPDKAIYWPGPEFYRSGVQICRSGSLHGLSPLGAGPDR